MLWPKRELDVAFDQIRSDSLAGETTVLLLVAPDGDAMCACRLFTSLLRAELISFSLVPVRGYSDMMRVNEEKIKGNEELHSIILINCGAMVDLNEMLSLGPNTRCYVIDSHRPYNLANVYDSEKIIIFDDEAHQPGEIPSDGEDLYALTESETDESEEDEEDDDDEENEMGKANADSDDEELEFEPGKKKKKGRSNDDTEEPKDRDGEDSDASQPESPLSESDSPLRRKKRKRAEEDKKAVSVSQRRDRRRRIHEYYRCSYFGCPSSYLVFELAQQLNKDNNDLLWLAIVGLSCQYNAQQIDHGAYSVLVQIFQKEVISKNSDAPRSTTASDGTVIPVAEHGRIDFEEDYRFMLHRHWSLFDAMYHSQYIAAKLGTWQSRGYAKLQTFIAKMGLSLKQAQQKFTFMNAALKERLHRNILEYADEFDLDDIFFGSFKRQLGYKNEISAIDVAYSLSALLEAPAGYVSRRLGSSAAFSVEDAEAEEEAEERRAARLRLRRRRREEGVELTQEDLTQDADQEEADLRSEEEEREESHWRENFHHAYSALANRSNASKLMEEGLHLSMALQRAIVRQGTSILEKHSITRAGPFRYSFLHIMAEEDERLFSHHLALSKLALFLVDTQREAGRWVGSSALPLLLFSFNEKKGIYLVVAVPCPESYGDVVRNRFGKAFQLAAEKTEGHLFRHDGFESSVIEIAKEYVHQFIEDLHETLTA